MTRIIYNDGPIAGTLQWFLIDLFLTEVMYFFIDKIANKFVKNSLIIFLSVFGCIATIIIPFRLPFGIDTALVGIGLFHIGYLIKKYKNNKYINKIFNIKLLILIPLIIISGITIFLNKYVNMRMGIYGILPLFWLNSVYAFIIIINISKILDKFLKYNLKKYIVNIGKNSIVYVCLNQIVIISLNKLLQIFIIFENINNIDKVIIKIFELFLAIFILYILSLIIQNTKLKKIIGR